MKNDVETKKKFITYEKVCEEAFEPTIDLMMKKYDVLSMTNEQLGDAYQEVRDAVEERSEEFLEANKKVINMLLRRYKKLGVFDMDTHPDVIKEKEEELKAQRLIDLNKGINKNPTIELAEDY